MCGGSSFSKRSHSTQRHESRLHKNSYSGDMSSGEERRASYPGGGVTKHFRSFGRLVDFSGN